MAKSIALTTAQARIAELELELNAANNHVVALESRLVVATSVFKAQRATIRELESKLATRGCIDRTRMHVATDFRPENEEPSSDQSEHAREAAEFAALHCGIGYIKTTPKAVVTTFTKTDGSVWEKTRVGNRATLREVTHA